MTEWQHSSAFNPLRKIKLAALTEGELRGLVKDMSAARTYHAKMSEAFARSIKELQREISLRAQTDEVLVTDHAIVRYLERMGGLDIEAVREKIRRLDGEIAPRNGDRILSVLPPNVQS